MPVPGSAYVRIGSRHEPGLMLVAIKVDVYIHIHKCAYTYTYIYVYKHIHVDRYMYIYIYVYFHLYIHVYIYMYMSCFSEDHSLHTNRTMINTFAHVSFFVWWLNLHIQRRRLHELRGIPAFPADTDYADTFLFSTNHADYTDLRPM